jgi:hypothetical protein
MRGHLAPLEGAPVSVFAPFISYPTGHFRHENAAERRAALMAALGWIELGTYDQRIVEWLLGWEVPVVATVISLLWRARHAAATAARQGGGEPR